MEEKTFLKGEEEETKLFLGKSLGSHQKEAPVQMVVDFESLCAGRGEALSLVSFGSNELLPYTRFLAALLFHNPSFKVHS